MAWVKASAFVPPENEPVHVYDNANNRILTGRFVNGCWYIEHPLHGGLTEITGVTHWAYIFDSELHDDSDDD